MTDQEKKNKRKGLITSLTIHALLLLAFAFLGMTYVFPPPEEGMMINFGNTETGLGTVESDPAPPSETVEEVVEEVVQPQSVAETSEPQVEEEVITQESEEAIALRKQKEAQERAEAEKRKLEKQKRIAEEQKRAEEERKRQEQIAKSNALFEKAQAGKGTGGGEGNTKPGGNQGSLDGTSGAPHGLGGSGDGFSVNLKGRTLLKPPNVDDKSQFKGDVVVDIWVDKYGNVVRAEPGGRGSTTTNAHLYKVAKIAAMGMKFDPKPDGLVQQPGSVTIEFVLQ
jgi:colicin import membrane protein